MAQVEPPPLNGINPFPTLLRPEHCQGFHPIRFPILAHDNRGTTSERIECHHTRNNSIEIQKGFSVRRLTRVPHAVVSTTVLAIAVLVAAVAPPVSAVEAPPGGCEVPDVNVSRAATPTSAGYEHQRWVADEAGQKAMSAIESSMRLQFGEQSKESPYGQLANGLIGITVDDRAKQVVAVIDPALVDGAALTSRLSKVAQNRAADAALLDVRVQAGCHSARDLMTAISTIQQRDWHPQATKATYVGSLNPRTSTYEYTFAENDRAVGEALQARLGDLVTVDFGPAGRYDRADDGQPHWGGAGIGLRGGSSNFCTSGFTVNTQSAGKAMVTAGHCFENGEQVESGDEAYGMAQGKTNYPAFDMMLINASNQNYDDDVYHNPIFLENSPLDVRGGADAAVGTVICISGMISKAVCGNRVANFTGEICDPPGVCTRGLMTTTNTTTACRRGDSGAPMYQGVEPTTIRGLFIGGNGTTCFGERVSAVQAHLRVTVASSP
jgi:hypothetical protein